MRSLILDHFCFIKVRPFAWECLKNQMVRQVGERHEDRKIGDLIRGEEGCQALSAS